MNGPLLWLTGYLDGNTGKYYLASTYWRAYYYQCAAWAGGTVYVPDGVDFAALDNRPHYAAIDHRLHYVHSEG